MSQTIEAIIQPDGQVQLLGKVSITQQCRAIVTVLEDASPVVNETGLLSETALAVDWNRPEEDQAWQDLSSAQ